MNLNLLNRARNVFLAAARRQDECSDKRVAFTMLADAVEAGIDKIDEQGKELKRLEIAMRTADDAVKALVADDKALRQQVTDLQTAGAAKDEQIKALEANSITSDTLATVNELVPESPPQA